MNVLGQLHSPRRDCLDGDVGRVVGINVRCGTSCGHQNALRERTVNRPGICEVVGVTISNDVPSRHIHKWDDDVWLWQDSERPLARQLLACDERNLVCLEWVGARDAGLLLPAQLMVGSDFDLEVWICFYQCHVGSRRICSSLAPSKSVVVPEQLTCADCTIGLIPVHEQLPPANEMVPCISAIFLVVPVNDFRLDNCSQRHRTISSSNNAVWLTLKQHLSYPAFCAEGLVITIVVAGPDSKFDWRGWGCILDSDGIKSWSFLTSTCGWIPFINRASVNNTLLVGRKLLLLELEQRVDDNMCVLINELEALKVKWIRQELRIVTCLTNKRVTLCFQLQRSM